MNVLVIGSGAREHAIAWKLKSSPQVDTLFTAPGNPGTAAISTNLNQPADDLDGLAQLAKDHRVELTIVGPEGPLASGIVDLFNQHGLPIFGPSKAASQLESSKAFAKLLMRKHGVPGPDFKVFHSFQDAEEFLSTHEDPVVVKADGLAAGKGVQVCKDKQQALKALHECMQVRLFDTAGDTVVVEEYLEGQEVSAFTFTDGEHISSMVAACDYKRVHDNDGGPNTGGMGSYSPPEFWTSDLECRVQREIMTPVVRAMAEGGTPYRGLLYAGLMLTPKGPQVLEFNCRFGDPEVQVILPRLNSDLAELALACIEGRIDHNSVDWTSESCVGVVMASGGYPGEYKTGFRVSGITELDPDLLVFHAGTKVADQDEGSSILTNGGRVLTLVGTAPNLEQARQKVYDNIGRVHFEGAHYRKDIALPQKARKL